MSGREAVVAGLILQGCSWTGTGEVEGSDSVSWFVLHIPNTKGAGVQVWAKLNSTLHGVFQG